MGGGEGTKWKLLYIYVCASLRCFQEGLSSVYGRSRDKGKFEKNEAIYAQPQKVVECWI